MAGRGRGRVWLEVAGHGRIRVPKGASILSVCRKHGIPVTASCDGRAECGQCRIRVVDAGKPNDADRRLIAAAGLRRGLRLACRYRVHRNTRIELTTASRRSRAGTRRGMGLALDLGTTMIKAAAVDLSAREICATYRVPNPQNTFGADVVTRIGWAMEGKEVRMRSLLRKGVSQARSGLGLQRVRETVVAGNPVMTAFYLNRSVKGLAHYPYNGPVKEGFATRRPKGYVFGSLGGYVGGDTIAGMLASGLPRRQRKVLYLDLGTNGEVALVSSKILVCSTAAGPAFEGVGLRIGSPAVPGAIDEIGGGTPPQVHTIGDAPALGFCASGLIDLLAYLIRSDAMRPDGRLLGSARIAGLAITQPDIRQLQLAIAAIRTGIAMLLARAGLRAGAIEEVIMTGEFGSRLNRDSLVHIGLLPRTKAQVEFNQDLPLRGAAMLMADPSLGKRVTAIERSSEHVELALEPGFEERFVEAMHLAPWD